MEFHPILEHGCKPNKNLWYVISSPDPPSVRVGQACVYCDQRDEKEKKNDIYILGGADPSTTFNDIYRLDLHQFKWNKISFPDFEERYEHCAFVSETDQNIYVFGGANKSSNLNSMQVIDSEKCYTIQTKGKTPSPRTMHSAASSGSKLYVWGGGSSGSIPVSDLQLHVFDALDKSWAQPVVKGKLPSARHGHISVITDKFLYIHGGMSGSTFHKDLHSIDIKTLSCQKLKSKGDIPCARAAHAAATYNKSVFIFGGMCEHGALDDMFQLNTDTNSWLKLKFDCPPPTPRLDHSLIIAHLPCKKDGQTSKIQCTSDRDEKGDTVVQPPVTTKSNSPSIIPVDIWGGSNDADSVNKTSQNLKECLDLSENKRSNTQNGNSLENFAENKNLGTAGNVSIEDKEISLTNLEIDYIPVCVVFGGMDTSGNVFNDLLVMRVD